LGNFPKSRKLNGLFLQSQPKVGENLDIGERKGLGPLPFSPKELGKKGPPCPKKYMGFLPGMGRIIKDLVFKERII